MNVLVINHCGTNRGDRAILRFVARELSRNGITSVTVSSSYPESWRDVEPPLEGSVKLVPWGFNVERRPDDGFLRHKLLSLKMHGFMKVGFPWVRNRLLKGKGVGPARLFCNGRFVSAVEKTDLVIRTRGHHVTTLLAADAVSPQMFDMGLALMSGKPLVLWSQSIGPLEFINPSNREFVRRVLEGATRIHVRETQSMDEMSGLGVGGSRIRHTYDSVIGLNDLIEDHVPSSRREPTVGIAVYSIFGAKPEAWRKMYVRSLSALVTRIAGKGMGVRFFPMQLAGHPADDRPLIRQVIEGSPQGGICSIEDDMEAPEHIRKVGRCRMFVGHKTHSVIFALTAGTPLVALAYHTKTQDFMGQDRVPQYCIPDDDLSEEKLLNTFDALCRNADDVGQELFQKSRTFGEKVRRDFGDMLEEMASGAVMP